MPGRGGMGGVNQEYTQLVRMHKKIKKNTTSTFSCDSVGVSSRKGTMARYFMAQVL